MTELKPCPFCSGKAKVSKDTLVYTSVPNGAQYIVWCTKCGCRSPINIENEEEAIEAWNKRPNPWHTGTPTEDGQYLVAYECVYDCKNKGKIEYFTWHIITHEDRYREYRGRPSDGVWKAVAWQEINLYKRGNK